MTANPRLATQNHAYTITNRWVSSVGKKSNKAANWTSKEYKKIEDRFYS